MRRKRTVGAAFAVFALVGATLLATTPASATDEKHGYTECNATRTLRVASTTVSTGGTFAVGHAVTGGSPTSVGWSSAGYHQSSHGVSGGNWAISTTGTIQGGGASCGS